MLPLFYIQYLFSIFVTKKPPIFLPTFLAPLDVTVVNVTYNSAEVCWKDPLYGEVSGYGVIYHPKYSVSPQEVNLTVDYDSNYCQKLTSLEDDTEYILKVYGFNDDEKGQISLASSFHTAVNGKLIYWVL